MQAKRYWRGSLPICCLRTFDWQQTARGSLRSKSVAVGLPTAIWRTIHERINLRLPTTVRTARSSYGQGRYPQLAPKHTVLLQHSERLSPRWRGLPQRIKERETPFRVPQGAIAIQAGCPDAAAPGSMQKSNKMPATICPKFWLRDVVARSHRESC